MPRCCGGQSSTLIQAGSKVTVSGNGTAQSPYVIGADVGLTVTDNTTFDLTLTGAGTAASPWNLTVGFAATASINDFPDVDTAAKANGKVLGYNSTTQHWEAQTAPTAAPGAISHAATLTGDGSVGSPLAVTFQSGGYLDAGASGIEVSATGKNQLVQHFGNAAARDAAIPTPNLNQLVMLDTNPGVTWYWTGTVWAAVNNLVSRDFGTAFLPLSGAYSAGLPVVYITRVVSVTTGADGSFDALNTTDLSGKAGVLSCHVQPAGSTAYTAVVYANIDHISAIAYRLDDGTPLVSTPITAIVTGFVY